MIFRALRGGSAAGTGKTAGIYFGQSYDPQTGRLRTEPTIYGLERHALLFGPTGCGKTSGFLLPNLLGDTLNDHNVIVFDPKAECCAVSAAYRYGILGHNVKILDPFGKMKEIADSDPQTYRYLIDNGLTESSGFNPLRHLGTGPNFYDDAAGISEALIQIEGKDPHWPESARGLMAGMLMWEKLRRGNFAKLSNVRGLLTQAEKKEMKPDVDGVLKETVTTGLRNQAGLAVINGEKEGASVAQQTAASLLSRYTSDTREIQSIRSNADTQTRWMLSTPMREDLNKEGIDFARLKTDPKPTTVYVVLPAERMRTHAVWLRLVIVCALRALYRPGGRRTVLFVDEMPALGYLAPLADAFGLVRGYGVQIVGISQDLNQLKALYKEHWESFTANAGCIMAYAPNDLTTAEWMSRRSGEHHVNTRTINIDPSLEIDQNSSADKVTYGKTETSKPFYLPQTLFGFPQGTGLIFLAGVTNSIRFNAPVYAAIPKCNAAAMPNPFYNG